MKTIKSKKLNKQIDTVCDFNSIDADKIQSETTSGDTTATMTIIVTTINTQTGTRKLAV